MRGKDDLTISTVPKPIDYHLTPLPTQFSYIAHLATILILSPEESWVDQPCVRHWGIYQVTTE